MQQKRIRVTICIISALLLALSVAASIGGIAMLTMPFSWLAGCLRAWSLSGKWGNVAAIAAYILIALLPLLGLIKKKLHTEDWLLPVASGCILYGLYYMINPGLRPVALSGNVGTLICVGSVFLILFSWWIIRLLRVSEEMDGHIVYALLRGFLILGAIICLWSGLGAGLINLRTQILDLQAGNTMPGLNLVPTYIFQVLRFAVTALEYVLDAFILILGVKFLKVLEQDPYGEPCSQVAEHTAAWCRRALIIILLSHSALNLGQIFCASVLHQLSATFRFPIMSIGVAFIMMILTRLLQQGKQLKDDNDLFI